MSAANRALMSSLAEQGVQTHILANGAVSMYSQAEVDEAQMWLDKFVTGFVSYNLLQLCPLRRLWIPCVFVLTATSRFR